MAIKTIKTLKMALLKDANSCTKQDLPFNVLEGDTALHSSHTRVKSHQAFTLLFIKCCFILLKTYKITDFL